MKKLMLFSILTITLMSLLSCSEKKPYTIEDTGKTINLSMDDPFEVQLRSNASTGYEWEILPYDKNVIKQTKEPEYTADDNRIGSGGNLNFKFKSVGEGSTELVMVYKRKWEDPNPDDKTFRMKIVCGTMGRILSE